MQLIAGNLTFATLLIEWKNRNLLLGMKVGGEFLR